MSYFISRADSPIWNNNLPSGFISIRPGPLGVQPGYNIILFESNNAQLVRYILWTSYEQETGYRYSTPCLKLDQDVTKAIINYKKRRKVLCHSMKTIRKKVWFPWIIFWRHVKRCNFRTFSFVLCKFSIVLYIFLLVLYNFQFQYFPFALYIHVTFMCIL